MSHHSSESVLIQRWTRLSFAVEQVCETGIAQFLASWDEPSRRRYADAVESARRVIADMKSSGMLRAERVILVENAISAHGVMHRTEDSLEAHHVRDQSLRSACAPPAAIAKIIDFRLEKAEFIDRRFLRPSVLR